MINKVAYGAAGLAVSGLLTLGVAFAQTTSPFTLTKRNTVRVYDHSAKCTTVNRNGRHLIKKLPKFTAGACK